MKNRATLIVIGPTDSPKDAILAFLATKYEFQVEVLARTSTHIYASVGQITREPLELPSLPDTSLPPADEIPRPQYVRGKKPHD